MGKSKEEKPLRRDVTLKNKEVAEVLESVELISGVHLDMTMSFNLGILRRTLKMANEVYDELSKNLFTKYSVVRKDENKKDQRIIPVKKVLEFNEAKAELDNAAHVYSLPSFSIADFTAEDGDDDDDPLNKIPNGFITRILPILTDFSTEQEVVLPESLLKLRKELQVTQEEVEATE